MNVFDKLIRDIDRAQEANMLKFMEAVHTTLTGLLEGVLDLDRRLKAIEATNRSPEETERGDTGTLA